MSFDTSRPRRFIFDGTAHSSANSRRPTLSAKTRRPTSPEPRLVSPEVRFISHKAGLGSPEPRFVSPEVRLVSPKASRRLFLSLLLLLLWHAHAMAAGAQVEPPVGSSVVAASSSQQAQGPTISYELGMSRPTTHLYEVTMTLGNLSAPFVDVQFPAWTPGAYRIVNAARNVQEFRAGTTSGQPLPATKTYLDTWRIETRGNNSLRVSYKVYADNITVTGAHLDDTHAFFNGSLLFAYVVGAKDRPVTLTLNYPPRWTVVSTGLDAVAGRPNTYAAPDYDTFVDAPFEIGTHNVMRFDYRGAQFEIAIYGRHNFDLERLRREVEQIVRSQVDMMGGPPFRRYVFIYHMLPNGRGGLEHLNSTVINQRKWTGNTEEGLDYFRGVTSHEFFHLWNVKRLRPEPLGPFDYTRPVTTRDLYVSEGMTSYYGDLHVLRSGVWTRQRYLKNLADEIQTLQDLPGRRILTVEESSINTWYSPDDPVNTSFSYYNKGELLGALLDLEMRQRTKNARTLDDVFRYLLETYGLPKAGWPPGGFQRAVETVAGSDFSDFFTRYVAGTEELPYERTLAYAGLRLERKESPPADIGVTFESPAAPPLSPPGAPSSTQFNAAAVVGLVVTGVNSEGPAYNVLAPDDVLLAIDGERVTRATLAAQLARFREGQRVPLTIFRGDRLLEVSFTMQVRPTISYAITEDPGAAPEQKLIRDSWLRGSKSSDTSSGSGNAAASRVSASATSAVVVAGVSLCDPCRESLTRTLTAAEANASFVKAGQRPPYAPGTEVREVVLQEETLFVRVHGERNQQGAWLMPSYEIAGLTPEQIRDRFALPEVPLYVSDVYVPAGTHLRVGSVAAQAGWGRGGATQYQLLDRLPSTAFRNRRPLP